MGHLERAKQKFGYLKKRPNRRIVVDSRDPTFLNCKTDFKKDYIKELQVPFDNAALVFKMSGSCNNIQLAAYQPRSQMAVLLDSVLPKDFGQIQLTKGITSLLLMTVYEEILLLKRMSLPFSRVISTLYWPFCSDESPTCNFPVPFGSPMQTFHLWASSFTYLRKGTCSRLS
jgi:hypothetical protein